jgi:hypothetical protein
MAMAFLNRLKLLFKELGAVATPLYLADHALRRMAPRSKIVYYRFLAQPLLDQPRVPSARGRALAFRLLRGVEPELAELNRPHEIINQRFARGAQCLLATKGQRVVGCIWFIHQAYLEDEVRVKYVLPADGHCVWDFDVYVAPSERLGWLFAKQWDAFDALLRPSGVRYSVSRINAFNRRSLDSHKRLGASDCGWALFLCLGSQQCMLSSLHPYLAWGGLPQVHVNPRDLP